MALGDTYATLDELKSYLMGSGNEDGLDDDELTDALQSVSREIEHFCGRQFNDAGSASARLFYPLDRCVAYVDDFSTTADLVISTDEDGDGQYETTWTSSEFELQPLNGSVDGETGWPFYRIAAVGPRRFPHAARRAPLQVTAQWGWAAVPAPVKQSALILAAETHKLRNAPFGVAGFGQFGAVRVRDNPLAHSKLAPYMLDAAKVL